MFSEAQYNYLINHMEAELEILKTLTAMEDDPEETGLYIKETDMVQGIITTLKENRAIRSMAEKEKEGFTDGTKC